MKSSDFLDLLQAHYGVASDRKLADRLGWDQTRVSKYRTGSREFDDATCAEVAERLELAPAYVMAEIAAERADCTKVRETWEALARMLKDVKPHRAAVLLLAFIGSQAALEGARTAVCILC